MDAKSAIKLRNEEMALWEEKIEKKKKSGVELL